MTKADSKVAKARKYIEENYGNVNLNSEQISETCGISVRHLRRKFLKTYGMGIKNYIMLVRIEEAKKLLQETSLPIKAVILMVGYDSASYFRKLFKERVGCTMTEYRTKE